MATPTERSVADLERNLHTVSELADRLAPHITDLYLLAFERVVGGQVERGGRRQHWWLDEVGDRRAKEAIQDLFEALDHAAITIDRSLRFAENLLVSGPSPDNRLRGTLLGDDQGNGAQAELREALHAQERRQERGDYTPHRTAIQPKRVSGG